MSEQNAEADRAAVILQIEAVAVGAAFAEQGAGRFGQMVEGVGILRGRRRVALAKTRVVGRNHMAARREKWDQRLEHARGRWEAVQEHDDWRVFGTGLAVKNADPVDHGAVVGDRRRGRGKRRRLRGARRGGR
jgi:hypothetical protein